VGENEDAQESYQFICDSMYWPAVFGKA